MSDLINNNIDKFSDESVKNLFGIVTKNVNKEADKYKLQLKKIKEKQNKIAAEQNEYYLKQMKQNTSMNSKEQFQQELDKLNLSNNLKAVAFTILDIGLTKLNRLPLRITQEDKISIKLEYYDSANSIMYVEGNIYGKYKYCDLESGIGESELEECFNNRANLKLAQILEAAENDNDFLEIKREEANDKWRKLHEFLNEILGLSCEDGCITNDEELILAVKEKLKFEEGMK